MHCRRFIEAPISRRDMLARCANGFGAVALAALAADPAYGASADNGERLNPLAPRPSHFRARAKNVIFLFMDGGPSQMDTFDPKPRLDREHGEPNHDFHDRVRSRSAARWVLVAAVPHSASLEAPLGSTRTVRITPAPSTGATLT